MCRSPPPVKAFPSANATDDRPLFRHFSTLFTQTFALAIPPLCQRDRSRATTAPCSGYRT